MPYKPSAVGATISPVLFDYAAVKDYLYALKAGGMKFGIDRMQRLAAALGHPERGYPVIHVAGTNGKGSVSAMIESVMRAAGRRTGLYTSPHLVKLGERVQVDRRLLSETEIVAYANELRPVAEKAAAFAADEHATFFEFMTAMAFLQFQRRRVDIAVIETGMGGRLDATNVVQPAVSVITSIGLDHCAELGGTVEQIAREKAGIIKSRRPVVIGRMPAGAERVIREVAASREAPVHSVREAFGEEPAGYPTTNLEGDYQRWNAATATLAARLLPADLQPDAFTLGRGLGRVDWPGRWQRLTVGGRALILDASHNPEGAEVLEKNLLKLVAVTGRKPVIVAGALGEFRARALLEVVLRHAREVSLVTPHQARATPYAEMIALVAPAQRALVREDSLERIFPDAATCTLGAPGDTIVVTGSIYLLGEVLERLQPDGGAREDKLQDF
ncbi:Dihydrofolate synthase / folylpolyglutamate synthase [uncultured Defluviicoccus sp.]|uniref:tetrahydrofolate synthase n=1 Tax=metagenome TaxID=256318 RepID=A0A380TA59_9ZZZZ|nr:Dihydrofolate synthase / folylpolyglutamate synthase [uncultured Defluviicoccus sp.]